MSGELEVIEGGEIVERRVPQWLQTPQDAKRWADNLREMRRSVLVDGTDFARIPGTPRPSLLKSGAEMLLLAAGCGFTMMAMHSEAAETHEGVTYKCRVTRGGEVVAECEAYAGYDEDRFWQKGRTVRAPWNTVIKMAQKRALVGAALNACAASGLFSQDMEDDIAPRPSARQAAGPAPAAKSRRAVKGTSAPLPPPSDDSYIHEGETTVEQLVDAARLHQLRLRYEALDATARAWVLGERQRLTIPSTAAPDFTVDDADRLASLLDQAESGEINISEIATEP